MDNIRLVPLFDKDGVIELYDIFINNEWIGSRRTEKQCMEEITQWHPRHTK